MAQPHSTDSVSVVVLSFDKVAYTRRCIESLMTSTHRPMELIVVDQGSTDGTREMLEELHPRLAEADVPLSTILLDGNVGAPAGRNLGMDKAKGDYIAFLDNDIVVKDCDWLEKIIECLKADPSIGVVSPKLLFPGKDRLVEFAGCAVSPGGRVQYIGRGESADDPSLNQQREVQCLISACIVLPREAQQRVGHMDEAFSPVQFEDLDYCYRLKELGYICYYLPSVEMYHYEHITTDGSVSFNFKLVTLRNWRLFRERWKHVFSTENGPPDEEVEWREIDRERLDEDGQT